MMNTAESRNLGPRAPNADAGAKERSTWRQPGSKKTR